MKAYLKKCKVLFICSSLFFLISCTKPQVVPITQTVEIKVPPFLALQTPEPYLKISKNADLIELILLYKEALRQCNADKRKIGEL